MHPWAKAENELRDMRRRIGRVPIKKGAYPPKAFRRKKHRLENSCIRRSRASTLRNLLRIETPGTPNVERSTKAGEYLMKVCDLTQFYSPFSGGVKRYLEEKRKYAVANGHQHLLIIPGEQSSCSETVNSRTYSIKSPLVSRTSRYRALLNLGPVQALRV